MAEARPVPVGYVTLLLRGLAPLLHWKRGLGKGATGAAGEWFAPLSTLWGDLRQVVFVFALIEGRPRHFRASALRRLNGPNSKN
jgi:hypothetical protein